MTSPPRVRLAAGGAAVTLDEISKQILEQLQHDGRKPYAAIGKAVGLSEAAVRQRVQRLLDQGVMRIVAVTDPRTLGLSRRAMIGVTCAGDLELTAEELASIEEIEHVALTAGSFDVIVQVLCESDDHLLDTLAKIRAIPTVKSTETFVYLKQTR